MARQSDSLKVICYSLEIVCLLCFVYNLKIVSAHWYVEATLTFIAVCDQSYTFFTVGGLFGAQYDYR